MTKEIIMIRGRIENSAECITRSQRFFEKVIFELTFRAGKAMQVVEEKKQPPKVLEKGETSTPKAKVGRT